MIFCYILPVERFL